jgi:ABC-2 type transport system permease protein
VNQQSSASQTPARHVGCAPGPVNPFQPALWQRAVSRAWRQLAVSSVLMMLFGWIFVWLMSLVKWAGVLQAIPDFFKQLLGDDVQLYASKPGQVSVLFNHLVTQLVCMGWAIGRGSDVVAGEISRGTMEHLLTLPVRRIMVLLVPSIVATLGAAVLALATLIGLSLGLATVQQFHELSPWTFVPGAVNLFSMTFFMAAMTTLLSSFDDDRWRTVWRAAGLFVLSVIVFMVGFLWPAGAWLKWCCFHGAFQPQTLILKPHETWTLALGPLGSIAWPLAVWFNLVLVFLGVACYVAATAIFVKRDIPIPR